MATSAQVALLSAHQNPYPGAILALDIIGSRTNGQQYYMLNGAVTTQFSSLPNLTVSRTTTGGVGSYAANADGSLVKFADGVARITNQGLLVEEARTNVAFPSTPTSLPNGSNAWNGNFSGKQSTIVANDRIAPDGTLTASRITTTGISEGLYYRSTAIPSANAAWTSAIYVYVTTPTTFTFSAGGSGGTAWTGTVNTSPTVPANVWTRVQLPVTAAASVTATSVTWSLITATSGTAFWVWQGDATAGAFITSPIPTTSASVTRSADVVSIGGLSLSGDHTAVLESMGVGGSAIFVHSRFSDGTSNNYDQFAQFSTATQLTNQSVAGGVAQVSNNGAITQGAVIKSALTFGAGRYQTATGGVLGTAATGKTSFTASKLDLGHAGGSNQLNSYVRRVLWYPTAFTDAQLQSATQ